MLLHGHSSLHSPAISTWKCSEIYLCRHMFYFIVKFIVLRFSKEPYYTRNAGKAIFDSAVLRSSNSLFRQQRLQRSNSNAATPYGHPHLMISTTATVFQKLPCVMLQRMHKRERGTHYCNWSRRLSMSCGFDVLIWLNGSRSCFEWRLLGTQGTLN